ncbi:DUF6766 family protein [Actinosynnema sp. NPDC047251]|uniref:Uncharacterized protein n=1 Tax=Saccharothrix espanaensis (strain ATCC 51144 / DSM 44229 / JCM 9112 / NBRC 15066 / NRRL 15764) TaxID=1179773 RepID=K0K362_SACES|nr:DUF6766 family protein [Saccharothrix espanaensis]CCH32022.1 hypothetical protein BN6_47470 [Saccharothrix espanaensis DSM 44229]
MKRVLRDNGLGIAFGLLFLAALVGQAIAGNADYNDHQTASGGQSASLGEYVTSSSFAVDVAENWQSEYLQFTLYIFATVWLVQRGSPESKTTDRIGGETDEQQQLGRHTTPDSPPWARAGGLRTAVFSNSLGLVMGALFVLSWLAQSVAGVVVRNAELLGRHQAPVSWLEYLGSADFWNRTLQNWQSEFLAIGSMVVLSIYLRQRGSPESKPVGAPHVTTDESG